MLDKTSSQEQFGAVAAAYLTSKAHDRPAELAATLDRCAIKGGRVLDIGTGAGHMAFALSPRVDAVVAFDLTPAMLAVVEAEAKVRGLANISASLGDAESLPYEAGTFDGVSCRVAAHHFHNVERFVCEAHRVLKPGGWFLLIDTVSIKNQDVALALDSIERRRDPSHVWNLSPMEWVLQAEASGFNVIWEESIPKPIGLEEWLIRMQVPDWSATRLRRDIFNSTGPLRDYLNPRTREGETFFDLLELTLFCRK